MVTAGGGCWGVRGLNGNGKYIMKIIYFKKEPLGLSHIYF